MSQIFPAAKKTLLQMLGPSIIFVALSLNGGEMLLWPHLVANYGFAILWPIPLILLLQFAVNIEIERYTLVTGNSVEEKLADHSIWLSVVFALTVLIALVWPAWITTAGNLIAVVFGARGSISRSVGLVISVALLLLAMMVFAKPKTYAILEKMAKVGLIIALAIIIFVVILRFDPAALWQGILGLTKFGYIPQGLPRFDFVAALAYGGVAGVLNLVQSEWVKDKGYGVNSLTAKTADTDFEAKQSKINYNRWFSLINQEHFLLFVLANLFSIFLLAYLGHILLPIGSNQGFEVLVGEIKALDSYIPYLGKLFALSGILIFTMANITILDAIGRLVHRLLSPMRLKKTSGLLGQLAKLNYNSISSIAIVLGILILLLSLLFPQFKQPFFLLVTSASLSAFSMWLYPPLLLRLNYRLPKASRPSWWRAALVILAALFYGGITLWAAASYIPLWIVITVGIIISSYHLYVLIPIFKNARR